MILTNIKQLSAEFPLIQKFSSNENRRESVTIEARMQGIDIIVRLIRRMVVWRRKAGVIALTKCQHFLRVGFQLAQE